jgi:hypothetical protein
MHSESLVSGAKEQSQSAFSSLLKGLNYVKGKLASDKSGSGEKAKQSSPHQDEYRVMSMMYQKFLL